MNEKMQVLITDGLFPNKYATWRNVEIISFIERFDASILVKHGRSWAGIEFHFDFENEIFSEIFSSGEYKIMIFDPEYNYLNKYNVNFDGTQFNSRIKHYSYLVTKNSVFDIKTFDFIYHIFLGSYYDFNEHFTIEGERQFIHLYPGGGYFPGQSYLIKDNVNLITTHPMVTKEIRSKNNPFIECLTAPMYFRSEKPIASSTSKSNLNVCFSSLGNGKAKGARQYQIIATFYRLIFPRTKVRFHSVGNCAKNVFIKHHEAMSFVELENFYSQNIDIYMNLATKHAFNGWPLGLEALKSNCILLTTDPDKVSSQYSADSFNIYPLKSALQFIKEIRKLEIDSNYLQKIRLSHKKFVEKFSGYDAQQLRIFDFIESKIADKRNRK